MPNESETIRFILPDDGVIPNNPRLPVVILKAALDPDLPPARIHEVQRANGWTGNWIWTVFDYHHWHPDAHEALSVAAGHAELLLGGPEGRRVHVAAGDTLILPAGTGHCRVASSGDFAVCGCYPEGQEDFTTHRATPEAREGGSEAVARVNLPRADPVYGADGPLMREWR